MILDAPIPLLDKNKGMAQPRVYERQNEPIKQSPFL